MATGNSRYADVSSLIPDIYEGALATLKAVNVLASTVTSYTGVGMQPRKVTQQGAANVRQVAEGEDITPTQWNKALLATLTPATHADMFLLTDERMSTDPDAMYSEAVLELGGKFAEYVDTSIATNFTSLTGGTVGAYLGTVTMQQIFAARSILQQQKVRGPYFCALGAGQWYHLMAQAGTLVSNTMMSDVFRDRLTQSYFTVSTIGDVTFAITPLVPGAAGGSATGALYAPIALAYDERAPFAIEPQRDASRRSTELNASISYATGVWRAVAGVQLRSTDVVPTT